MKRNITHATLALFIILSATGFASGGIGANVKDVWTFEEYDNGDTPITVLNNTVVTGNKSFQGDKSGEIIGGGSDAYDITEINETGNNKNLSFAFFLQDGSGSNYIAFRDSTSANNIRIYVDANEVKAVRPNGFKYSTGITLSDGDWYRYDIEPDYANYDFDLTVYNKSGGIVGSDTNVPMEQDSGTNTFTNFYVQESQMFSHVDLVGDESAVSALPPEQTYSLELEVNAWMPFNSTQDYTVLLNETNTTTGKSNITDVTANANVTVYNVTNTSNFDSPIATENNSTDQIESYDKTGQVIVNATYDGKKLDNASNVTVGKRNLTNIGIMPPEQWPCSFLGCDSAPGGGENPHNIGSPMQWTLLIIVLMVAFTRMFENPWAGIGTGIVSSVLIWVLGYIALGIMLSTVFSGIMLGLVMSRSDMGRGVTRDNEYSGVAGKNQK